MTDETNETNETGETNKTNIMDMPDKMDKFALVCRSLTVHGHCTQSLYTSRERK